MRRAARGLLALALLAAGACGGAGADGSVGPGGGIIGGSGNGGGDTGAIAERFVGRWSRIIYFYDEFGDLHSSQTVWTFALDGGGARTVFARNETMGWEDATVTLVRWSLQGPDVVVTYQPPDAGGARFDYRFESTASGEVLFLAGTAFLRIG